MKKTKLTKQKSETYQSLLAAIGKAIHSARSRVVQVINTEMVSLYWNIGRYIVEYEQKGKDRAQYGERLLEQLSKDLSAEFGKGFSTYNLKYMRMLYKTFPIRRPLAYELGWSHWIAILKVEEPLAREFYMKQCQKERWSRRELERQIHSMLFERLALSKDKKGVLALAKRGEQVQTPEDLLRNPYVFEFLNLPESPHLSETELEEKLIQQLQDFLLELGKGFCFVARQKRITVDNEHFYIDLVFYHRLLKSFVIINYIKHEESAPDDNPPIGILLCLEKNDVYVRYAIEGIESRILTGKFKLGLPSAAELKQAVRKLLK